MRKTHTQVGAGVLHKFGAEFFLFSGFHLPENGMLKPLFAQIFGAQIFTLIFAPIFAQIFGAQIFGAQIFGAQIFCADFWCADFCADFRADFPQIFLRRFGALKLGVPESCKNAQESAEKSAASQWPWQGGGGVYPIPSLLSRADSTSHNRRQGHVLRTQGEHVSVHRGIFGPLKGMLGVAPRFFKNENLRKNPLCETLASTYCALFWTVCRWRVGATFACTFLSAFLCISSPFHESPPSFSHAPWISKYLQYNLHCLHSGLDLFLFQGPFRQGPPDELYQLKFVDARISQHFAPVRGGGTGSIYRFCVSPRFTVVGGTRIPKSWEKWHEKCRCHTPYCAPQNAGKTMLADKAQEKDKLTFSAHVHFAPSHSRGNPPEKKSTWDLASAPEKPCQKTTLQPHRSLLWQGCIAAIASSKWAAFNSKTERERERERERRKHPCDPGAILGGGGGAAMEGVWSGKCIRLDFS